MKGNHVSASVLKVTSCRRARAHTDKQTDCWKVSIGPSVSIVDAQTFIHSKALNSRAFNLLRALI